ncbi:TetR family transcriptional regulator [Streptomyces sp. MP131-18]|uniref:TetR/AcrR family transcriptional regulator n=1 Tax=Streptomyces sp. MP131-18 TaxID=1857892 RepID=UPI00097BE30D|nr:TetR family transcriptional regulator [Streptomyces sp. MP131-18]ONK11364.1 mycofactocin system transcriptional regulator [Streptomyces sp. MP131-18]
MSETPRVPRAERRRRTEERILAAARELFAQHGFERTTIRAVASAAAVDPALVMQYYGSKSKLFARAAWHQHPETDPHSGEPAPCQAPPETPDEVVDALLALLGTKLNAIPGTSLAMLRSMLTHPEAGEVARETITHQINEIRDALDLPDPGARAALLISTIVGVTIGHQLLGLDALCDTPPEQLAELLRPALQALLTP